MVLREQLGGTDETYYSELVFKNGRLLRADGDNLKTAYELYYDSALFIERAELEYAIE